MANNLSSNIDTKVLKSIAAGFENSRVSTKTVNLENIRGAHDSSTGDTIYRKRKTSYRATETADGDVSSGAPGNDILVGRIPYVVQDVITVDTEWDTVEQALELNQLDELLMPMGEELITRAEINLNTFMLNRSGLTVGTPGTPVTAWSDVAAAEAMLYDIGAPTAGRRYYQMNSGTSLNLAGTQVGIPAQDRSRSAWDNAAVSSPLASLDTMKSNSLVAFTSGTSTDRIGALDANPDVTWATAKDTMTQTIVVTGFTASLTITAGEVIEVTGRFHTNPRTQQVLIDETGAQVKFRWTVTADVTLDASGEGSIIVTNAAIFDAASNNQYDNVSAAPVSTDVITLLGAISTVYKPNLFYHKDAFSFATVELPKLFATDSTYRSSDGLSYRVSRFSSGLENKQIMRVDLMPAFGVANPLHAGRAYGK